MRVRVVRFYSRYVEMYLNLKSATKCRQKLSPAVVLNGGIENDYIHSGGALKGGSRKDRQEQEFEER